MKILLTGDDGYNSLGIKILVEILKDKHELKISGTLDEMSSVGGHISIRKGGKIIKDKIVGIEALGVGGYPADAANCAGTYFGKDFDLVISGINLGPNVGNAVTSSGTVMAAYRAMAMGVAKRGITISWNSHPKYWLEKGDDLDHFDYMDTPGDMARAVIDLVLDNNLYKADILNINLPTKSSTQVKFARFIDDISSFYNTNMIVDLEKGIYKYPEGRGSGEIDEDMDAKCLQDGYITITPAKAGLIDEKLYDELKKRGVITL